MPLQAGFSLVEYPAGKLKVWDEPLDGASYVIGIDVAEHKVRDRALTRGKPTLGFDRPDFSCAIVLELQTGLHVASWHGPIEATEFSVVCCALGLYYNTALLVPEINGPGLVVVENLVKLLQYPRIYRTRVINNINADDPLGNEWGWRTTVATRPILVARIQETLTYGRLHTRDIELVKEMSRFQYDEQGVPRARGRDKDDRVIALGLALVGRADLLYGALDLSRGEGRMSRLSNDDRAMWGRVKAMQKKTQDARNRSSGSGPGARFSSLPRGGW